MDGRCDGDLYPGAEAYKNAAMIADYTQINAILPEASLIIRQDVLFTRMLTIDDDPGYQLVILIYCIVVVVWTASVMHRTMQRGARRAALASAILLLGWITARLINYQLSAASGLGRHLWYSYYLFQLALPLTLAWMAWVTDRPEGDEPGGFNQSPGWFRALALMNGALIVLVMTNDLHNAVFRLDLSNPNWSSAYEYGAGFYLVAAGSAIPLIAAIVIMMAKARQNPRRLGFMFPLALIALIAFYAAAYIMRVRAVWESDAAMAAGMFALLFFESAIRTGMIPVNVKYTSLFAISPLGMQITDGDGNVALSSGHAPSINKDVVASTADNRHSPRLYGEDTLLYSDRITGGRVLWIEDIANLNRLHRGIGDSVRKIQAANALLAEEEKIRRAVEEENARTQLLTQLEAEIARSAARLPDMLERLKSAADQRKGPVRIALLLCYIKRRCNLFFREREAASLPHEELTAYVDELAGIAGYADVGIIATSGLHTPISARRTTLFYDFFYNVADWASALGCTHMLAHVGPENSSITMRLLVSEDARLFQMDTDLHAAIVSEGGVFAVRDLEDAYGVSLSFKGGEADE